MKTSLFIPILIFITKTNIIEAVKNEETVAKVQAPTLVKAINNTSEQGVYFKTFILKNKGEFAKIQAVDYDELNVFCYEGVPAAVSLFWSSSGLKLDLSNNNYEVYIGNNISSVVSLLKARESEWIYSSLPWRSKEFKLSPFENACVGIQTTESYSISLQWKHVNYGAVLVTVLGLSMFMMAPKLCRNTFFHYTTGISFGLLLSTFIITYFIQRKIKQSFLSWFGLAYSLSVYMITKTWFNMKEWLTEQYFHYVVGYILVVSLVSFGFIYRVGLPSDNRTLNLIQWTMQLVASIMVLFSSYHTAASLSVMMSVITWYNIPAWLKYNAHTQIRKRFFKPKIKLLSEEEYNNQAHQETKRALEELKAFCRSPVSSPWKTVSRLQDPKRFAEFIEGSPHLTENEVMEYSHWEYNTDDEDEDRARDDEDLYTDDDEEADAASDENLDY